MRTGSAWIFAWLTIAVVFDATRSPAGTSGEDSLANAAEYALIAFFDTLSVGDYAAAVNLYGGEYDVLRSWNPLVPENDLETLLQHGCKGNGLQCLRVRRILDRQSLPGGSIRFHVEFSRPDGRLFVRGPCCGATAAQVPPDSVFSYDVRPFGDQYRVTGLPPYVP